MRNLATTNSVKNSQVKMPEKNKVSSLRNRLMQAFKMLGLASIFAAGGEVTAANVCKPLAVETNTPESGLVEGPSTPRPLGGESPIKTVVESKDHTTEIVLRTSYWSQKSPSFSQSIMQDGYASSKDNLVVNQRGKEVGYSNGEEVLVNGLFRIPEGENEIGQIELSIFEELVNEKVTIDLNRRVHTMKTGSKFITMVPVLHNGNQGYVAKSSIKKIELDSLRLIPSMTLSKTEKLEEPQKQEKTQKTVIESKTKDKTITAEIKVTKKKAPQYGKSKKLDTSGISSLSSLLHVDGLELDLSAYNKAIGLIESKGGDPTLSNLKHAKARNINLSKAAFGWPQLIPGTINQFSHILEKYLGISHFNPENENHIHLFLKTKEGHKAQGAIHKAYTEKSLKRIASNEYLIGKIKAGEITLQHLAAMMHHAGQPTVARISSDEDLARVEKKRDWLNTSVGNYARKVSGDYEYIIASKPQKKIEATDARTLASAQPQISENNAVSAEEAIEKMVPALEKVAFESPKSTQSTSSNAPSMHVIMETKNHMGNVIDIKITKEVRILSSLDPSSRQKHREKITILERHRNNVLGTENLLKYYKEVIKMQENKVLGLFSGSSDRKREEAILEEFKSEYSHMISYVKEAMIKEAKHKTVDSVAQNTTSKVVAIASRREKVARDLDGARISNIARQLGAVTNDDYRRAA